MRKTFLHRVWLAVFILLFINPGPLQAGAAPKSYLMLQSGHTAHIKDVRFSNSGKYILSSSYDHSIRLWDADNSRLIRVFDEHEKYVNSVTFSPDDNYILSGSSDKTVKIFETITGELVWNKRAAKEIFAVDFSPDGFFIAFSGMDPDIHVYDVKTKKRKHLLKGHTRKVCDIRFSDDGRYLASAGNDGQIIVWELLNGDRVKTHVEQNLAIRDIDFSKTGKRLAFGTAWKRKGVWDFTTDSVFYQFPESNSCDDVRFSPDGRNIALTYENDVIIADSFSGDVRTRIAGSQEAYAIDYSPDGRTLVVGRYDGRLDLYSAETGARLRSFTGDLHEITTVGISPAGDKIICGNINDEVMTWDISGSGQYEAYPGHSDFVPAVVTPDGKFLLTADSDEKVFLRNLETGKIVQRLALDCGYVNDLAVSPDGGELAVACEYGLYLFDVMTGKMKQQYIGHTGAVNSVVFTVDGNGIISGGDDTSVRLWDTDSGRQEKGYYGSTGMVKSVATLFKGKYCVASGTDNTIRLWDLVSGRLHSSYTTDCNYPVSSLTAFPDSEKILYSCGEYYVDQGNISTIDIGIGRPGKTFSASGISHVFSTAMSGDGRFLLSASKDGAVRIWDAAKGRLLATLLAYGKEDWVVLSVDGRFDGTSAGMEKLHYVQGLHALSVDRFYEKYYTPDLLAGILKGGKAGLDFTRFADFELPPKIRISGPRNNLEASRKSMEVEVVATDQGGGIDEIRLYHNGKMVETGLRGIRVTGNKGIIRKTFNVQLVNGRNYIRVTAYNRNRIESDPDEIVVRYQGLEKKADLYMLVVGLDLYKNPKYRLNYALTDAVSFKQTVEKGGSSIYGKVTSVFLKNSEVTRKRLLTEFVNFQSKAGQEDVFIFYYAGHGVMSEADNPVFYIIPYDVTQLYGSNEQLSAKAVSAGELQAFSQNLKAQKQLFIFDACQSGGMVDLFTSRGAAEEKAIAQLARSTGTFWLTASSKEQFASEFKELGHGIFTHSVLLGLSGEADGAGKDKKITVRELSSYLNDMVPELAEKYKGQAQYPNSYGYGQDFPIMMVK